MKLVARPASVHGSVQASPSKSYTHRAFYLGLLSEGETRVSDALLSEDPRATLAAVEALGAKVERGAEDGVVGIASDGVVRTPENVVDCLNSGTTMRLLAAIAALAPGSAVLTGDASLRRRPMQPLLDALRALNVRAESTRSNGCAPVIVGGPLRGGVARLPGDVSSQFVSALLLAGARSPDGVEVRVQGELKSRPYVDITLEMLADFGGSSEELVDGFRVTGAQHLRARDYRVPGDYSTAAFPLCAGALAGEVSVENLPERSAQGDRAIVDHLRSFGATIEPRGGALVAKQAPLRGIKADLSDTPDLFPALCAVAAHAEGETVLSGAKHLRFKESDRIALMVRNLNRMGVDCEEREDGAIVRGGAKVRGANGLVTEGDHRILMALAVCALRADGPIELDEADAYKVSYPSFVKDFQRLGQRLEVIA